MPDFNLVKKEKEILEFWKKNKIFQKSLEQNQSAGRRSKTFVFFEGPPTANGRPGLHHIEARSFKDIILRFRSMQGFFVPRKAGWDTHGLPVEVEVEKSLGLKSKLDIEKYGVEKFNQKAKESVWIYKDLWEKMTERLGFWLDLDNAYITYDPGYMETLFWIIKQFYQKKYLAEDFKVFPYCPRCATTLSNHEMNQPGAYRVTTDTSVYVKFRLLPGQKFGKYVAPNSAYILSWTTTPWTLPGNVALAVGKNINYSAVRLDGVKELLILASDLVEKVLKGHSIEVVHTFKGKDLVGLKYRPLFDISALKSKASYKVYPADFVTTEDGTGVVHTAVMYGEDDYKLGLKIGLPRHHTVDEQGRFTKDVKGFEGLAVKSKDAEIEKKTTDKIIDYLKNQGSLLYIENYSHDYPFCWRCDTPLLYYAIKAWVVKTSKIKSELLKNNEKINWVPEWVKKGRFGDWLSEGRDWNFSRNRYWGTPLPIWRCPKCQNKEVIGSYQELASRNPASNCYILMRHAGAVSNQKDIVSCQPEKFKNPLTSKGEVQIRRSLGELKKIKPDFIISSPLLRTKMTSQIIAKDLGIKILFDERLREIDTGELNGVPVKIYQKFMGKWPERYFKKPQDGESLEDVKIRTMSLVLELEKKYKNKTILLVSHEDPLWVLEGAMRGMTDKEVALKGDEITLKNGQFKEVKLLNIPRNEKFELDPHRPFIDKIIFKCRKCGGLMKRINELCDVWFDSGAMPFAQWHYPFNNKELIDKKKFFPADYITEAMDQTRGWFYTLLAISTLLKKGEPFKNVVVLGLVLDKHGKKMSKSRGNVIEPTALMEKYGADVVRWYFYTINQPAEAKRFDEQDLLKVQRNFFLIILNILNFYKTYKPKKVGPTSSKNLVEKWFSARLKETANKAVKNLEKYEIIDAARQLQTLLNDFSRWYLRRSRRTFQKPASQKELNQASYNLLLFILEFAKLLAPFAPYTSEFLYQEIKNDLPLKIRHSSIHLEEYPRAQKLSRQEQLIINLMTLTQELASKSLEKRSVKIRQPLRELKVSAQGARPGPARLWRKPPLGWKELRGKKDYLEILKDELNVKNIVFDSRISAKNGEDLIFDTTITPELKTEGTLRDLIRYLQEARAKFSLKPQDRIILYIKTSADFENFIKEHKNHLLKEINAKQITFVDNLKNARIIELETFGRIEVLMKKI